MSEVEKHYATETSGREPPPSRRDAPAGRHQADTLSDRARDVMGSVRDSVEDAASWSRDRYRESAEWVSDGYDSASRSAIYARRRTAAEFNRGARTVGSFVEENPIMVGVVGLAAGLLIGALLPGTRRENQFLGRYADDVRDQGLRYAREVAEQGRHLVEENLGRVAERRVDRDTKASWAGAER